MTDERPPRIPFNDLRRCWAAQPEARGAVDAVLSSGWYVLGPQNAAFEAELADYLGVEQAVGVASGTDALALALQAVGCSPGDRVATVPNAGGYTSTAAVQIGCTPVYVDVDEQTLLMSGQALAGVIDRHRPKAVVLTHLYGNLVAQSLFDVCRSAGVAVVEDCAQAIGAQDGGARAGARGEACAFSFYPTKNLGAVGDGGAVVTNSSEIAGTVRQLRQYGWDSKYHVSRPHGRNSRLDEVQAAVLRLGLPLLDGLNRRRRFIVQRYADALRDSRLRLVTRTDPSGSAHLAVLKAASPGGRLRAREQLAAKNIDTAIHYPVCDHLQPGFGEYADGPLPVAEDACKTVFSVPSFPELTDHEVDRVAAALREL